MMMAAIKENMNADSGRVCPVAYAGSLDNSFRRLDQNPLKILAPFIREGMVALDMGCGPGFFTLPMAQLVGRTGRVIAVDLQEGMLEKVRGKIAKSSFRDRITLQKCEVDNMGITEPVDFVLLFYMVHEIPDKEGLFTEIAGMLKPAGKILMVEPLLHVSKSAFQRTLDVAAKRGFTHSRGPRIFFSRTAVLGKGQPVS
jgi:ubiquinone/menaquinone biosynthesis C-methylase UbiE